MKAERGGAGDEQQFAQWVREGRLPELRAGVQQRSLRTAHALFASAFRLLRGRPFDALSVQEICAGAGATEGAFYGRFDDKRSFFVAMQRITVLRSEEALAAFVADAAGRDVPFERLCRMFVSMTVERYRANVGIYRAALQHADDGAWTLFRELGDTYRRTLTELLAPHLAHVPAGRRALRTQFAYQIVVGTLVHATLNDPGPLHLDDDALVGELSDVVVRYLSAA
jgi:AcrR family transcriptional regulator